MGKSGFSAFAWDGGNRRECQKLGVSTSGIESVLAHAETLIMPDPKNSPSEPRFLPISQTGRYTFVVFTPQQSADATLLRPISARYMHRTEINKYDQEIARAQQR